MFHVSGGWVGKTKEKQLVLYSEPKELSLGLRSGPSDTIVEIELGGVHKEIALGAWDQKVISIVPEEWKTVDRDADNDIFFVPLKVAVPHHEIWVSLLSGRREIDQFQLFGGRLQDFLESLRADIPDARLAGMIKEVNYYSSEKGGTLAAESGFASVRLSLDHTGLPAGAYTLSSKVNGLTENAVLGFQFRDIESGKAVGKQVKRAIRKGVQFVHVPLEKNYAPFGCEITVTALQGSGEVLFWEIKPDARKILQDLKIWQEKGGKPSWLIDNSSLAAQGLLLDEENPVGEQQRSGKEGEVTE
ncbi:MAG TPA: hypothetical protein ENO11_01700 [Desulfobacteraceae bacterium]|nr:hypothetical protein [Desulfobacteraceae bacterium]